VLGGDGGALAPHGSADAFAAALENGNHGLAGAFYGIGKFT